MEHFPRKKIKLPYESIMRATYGLPTKDDNTYIYSCFYTQLGALNDNACWEATQFYFSFLLFGSVQE